MSQICTSVGLFILRLTFGLSMLLLHGVGKYQRYDALTDNFYDPLGVGVNNSLNLTIVIEIVFPILLLIGCATRLASLQLVFTMLVALFLVHHADTWKESERAIIYMGAYATLIFTGPGLFSVDAMIRRKFWPTLEERAAD
ncbi:DoxX family protein [Blastopirellula sp. J2-11]|uniref:DoxX family protein n=1 Tax=Blastopirellula sp. J2-11 TaxID=2943192 RepID=UPI0021CA9ED3|nr:DoxX family protein [Blastopirellula sp. J2-11]UUO06574.1 DoxX family protein [Blastopirellula sp. J2-11]